MMSRIAGIGTGIWTGSVTGIGTKIWAGSAQKEDLIKNDLGIPFNNEIPNNNNDLIN